MIPATIPAAIERIIVIKGLPFEKFN